MEVRRQQLKDMYHKYKEMHREWTERFAPKPPEWIQNEIDENGNESMIRRVAYTSRHVMYSSKKASTIWVLMINPNKEKDLIFLASDKEQLKQYLDQEVNIQNYQMKRGRDGNINIR